MKIRDLFVLVIKLGTATMLIDLVFTSVPTLIVYFSTTFLVSGSDYVSLLSVLLSMMLLVVIFKYAGKLVDFLQVEKGFTSPIIPLPHLSVLTIAQLGIFFIGLMLFIQHLPSFLSNTWYWFKSSVKEDPYEYVQTGNYWFVSVFNLILAYFLVSQPKHIASFFSTQLKG